MSAKLLNCQTAVGGEVAAGRLSQQEEVMQRLWPMVTELMEAAPLPQVFNIDTATCTTGYCGLTENQSIPTEQ